MFTRRLRGRLDDESYALLQMALVDNPKRGRVIRGTGGLRKIRWGVEGGGKRGGVRVVYYWSPNHDVILMLMIYAKNEQDDLSADEKRVVRKLIERELP